MLTRGSFWPWLPNAIESAVVSRHAVSSLRTLTRGTQTWHAGEALCRVHGERRGETLREHGRCARVYRIHELVRRGRATSKASVSVSTTRGRAGTGHARADVHEAHAQAERALSAHAQVLEEEEYAALAVLVLQALCVRRQRADERTRVRVARERWERGRPVALAERLERVLRLPRGQERPGLGGGGSGGG